VRTYGQCCPIARASELLAERWSFIILRNIVLIGCRTFNEIADGAPGLSRGLLSKRLRDLEHAGVIQIRPKPDGPGSTYEPTQAGRELSEVMLALQRWGSQWAELTPEHAHPGVVLWGWVSCHLDRGRLPRRRVLVRFDYPTLSGPGSRGWLLIERGDAEICEKHPGGDEDLVVVVSDPVAFARWDLGELEARGTVARDEPITAGSSAGQRRRKGIAELTEASSARPLAGEVTMREAVPELAVANVLDYVAAWNEPDAATRLKLLERCWADDGAYVDPNVELRGRSALCEHISKVQAGRPGARLEMMSGIELHHHVVRFLWRLVRADGRAGETSIDVGEVDADGRLTKIVGFFGEPPKR
jgi:DNA-binding HxlR family transcriptional regulator